MRKIKTLLKILRSFFEKNILGSFFKLLKIKKIVLIESYPNFADSSLCVFNKMKELGIDKEFKLIWVVGKPIDNPNNEYNCCYRDGSFKERIRTIKLLRTASILISTNYFMVSYRKKQVSLYMSHGTCVKRVRSYFTLPKKINYILGTSPAMADVQCYELNFAREKAFICGLPRNDLFFKEKNPDLLLKMFGKKYDKTILWLPTFRQHKTGVHSSSSTAIPLLDSEENAVLINNHLKEKNILVIVKPHFAQDISFIKKLDLSNIVFIDESFMEKHNTFLYELAANVDSMISDYSSIYYDFLLADKPAAVVWTDYKQYEDNPGFAVDLKHFMSCAYQIYSVDDFIKYLDDMSSSLDIYQEKRREICKEVNTYLDNKNSERVIDFLLEKYIERNKIGV